MQDITFLHISLSYTEILRQLAVVCVSFVLASLLSVALNAFLSRQLEFYNTHKKAEKLKSFVHSYVLPLLTPTLLALCAATATGILYEDKHQAFLLTAAVRLSLLWLILRLIAMVTRSRGLRITVGMFLVPVVALDILGLTERVAMFLRQYSLEIGPISISLYVLLKGAFVIVLLLWLANFLSRKGKKYIKNLNAVHVSTRELLTKFFDIALYFTVIIIALNALGIDLTALAVFGGALGVGVGFGLQKIASNFISGIILLFEKSLEVGDLVELDSIYGFIRHLGARYTLVETFDGREVMVPNEDFMTARVTNWTYSNTKGRVEVKIGVAYGTDLEKAQKLILQAASEHPRVIDDPSPDCHLLEFGDNSINFTLFFWVADVADGRMGPQSGVMFAIWKKFQKAGIEIPFPQRDIYIKSLPKGMKLK